MTCVSPTLPLHRQAVRIALMAVLLAVGVALTHGIPSHGTPTVSLGLLDGSHANAGDGDASLRLTAICLGVVGSLLLVFGCGLERAMTKSPRLGRSFQVPPSPVASAGGETDLYLRLCVLRR